VSTNRLNIFERGFSSAAIISDRMMNLTEVEVKKFAYGSTHDEFCDLTKDSDNDDEILPSVGDMPVPVPETVSSEAVCCSFFRTWVGQETGIETRDFCDLSLRDMKSLCPGQWLSDGIINKYMRLLVSSRPGTYCLSSYTYALLLEEFNSEKPNFDKFRRYCKGINLAEYKYVLCPINKPGHWCLVVAYPSQLKLVYYDSCGGSDELCLYLLKIFFKVRGQVNFAEAGLNGGWTLETIGPKSKESIPAQTDAHSCGLFVCALADVLSAGGPIGQWGYSQEVMDAFRTLVCCLMKAFRESPR